MNCVIKTFCNWKHNKVYNIISFYFLYHQYNSTLKWKIMTSKIISGNNLANVINQPENWSLYFEIHFIAIYSIQYADCFIFHYTYDITGLSNAAFLKYYRRAQWTYRDYAMCSYEGNLQNFLWTFKFHTLMALDDQQKMFTESLYMIIIKIY